MAENKANLVDIEVVGGTRNPIVRLLIHADFGVSVDLCKAVSAEVADLLDVEDPFPGSYRLEVTSPGLDRHLQSDQDFVRAADRLLKVVTKNGKTITGRLKEWDPLYLYLEQRKERQRIERTLVAKATIEVEF